MSQSIQLCRECLSLPGTAEPWSFEPQDVPNIAASEWTCGHSLGCWAWEVMSGNLGCYLWNMLLRWCDEVWEWNPYALLLYPQEVLPCEHSPREESNLDWCVYKIFMFEPKPKHIYIYITLYVIYDIHYILNIFYVIHHILYIYIYIYIYIVLYDVW